MRTEARTIYRHSDLVQVLYIPDGFDTDPDVLFGNNVAEGIALPNSDTTVGPPIEPDHTCLTGFEPPLDGLANRLLGLSLAEAESVAAQIDVPFRAVGADGECLPRTDDLRSDRVNVNVLNGKVVGIAMG